MIRSTYNATKKSIVRSGMKGEGRELAHGSLDGILAAANVELTEAAWDANDIANVNSTVSVIHSNEHVSAALVKT